MAAVVCASAGAAAKSIGSVPTSWRLENYTNTGSGNVVAWFAGSSCSQGKLTLGDVDVSQKNRFWATIMTAKAAGKNVFVYYDDATPECKIISFGMD
jgi:hypothetical protein